MFKGGALDKSKKHLEILLRADPNDARALFHLGTIWYERGAFPIAAHYYERALAIMPDFFECRNNLSICYRRLDLHHKAIEQFDIGMKTEVTANILSNRGSCLLDIAQIEESERSIRRALVLAPKHNDANWNLALTLLSQRKWREGWAQHDWGFRANERGTRPYIDYYKPWDGHPLEGKTILIWGEQGIGDEILFAQCLNDLKRLNPKDVLFDCHPRLVKLFRRSFPWVRSFGRRKDHDLHHFFVWAAQSLAGSSREERRRMATLALETRAPPDAVHTLDGGKNWIRLVDIADDVRQKLIEKAREETFLFRWNIDYHFPLGGLPKYFRLQDAHFPSEPYLHADGKLVEHYKIKYPTDSLRVGLAWLGGSRKTAIHRRSIPLEQFAQLLKVPVTWISLQYGDVQTEVSLTNLKHGTNLIHDHYAIEDLDHLAALTKACDLVISVIQTEIHIAGALGVPTWCLTCVAPPWKFHMPIGEGEDDRLLWHRSVKMIRQKELGIWPMGQVEQDLRSLLASTVKDTNSMESGSLTALTDTGLAMSA